MKENHVTADELLNWFNKGNRYGPQGLIKYLSNRIGNPILLLNPFFELLGPENLPLDNVNEKELLPQLKQQYLHHKKNNAEKVIFKLDLNFFTPATAAYTLAIDEKVFGYLFILEVEKPINSTEHIINQSLPAILSECIKYQEITETEKKFQDNFIYDLLHNNFSSLKTIVKQGYLWGWDFTKTHQLLLFDLKSPKKVFPISLLKPPILQVVTRKFRSPIVIEHDEHLLVMIPESSDPDLQLSRNKIKALSKEILTTLEAGFPETLISIGIGRLYPSAIDLCRSYQEAKTALELGKLLNTKKRITHFDDLGLIRLLTGISYEQLNDFSLEYLAPLIDFDQANETNMLKTLEVFLQESGDYNNTAKILFIHPNTLRHRIKRIAEILNLDLEKYNNLVNLWTAIKIHIMLEDMLN